MRLPRLHLLLGLALAAVTATRAQGGLVTATGAITDTSSGLTGTVTQSIDLNFTPIAHSLTSLVDTFSGSGTTVASEASFYNTLLLSIIGVTVGKDAMDTDWGGPPPIGELFPPVFASRTNQTYSGTFTSSSPLFSFTGSLSRNPQGETENYTASINVAALPQLTGAFSFSGSLTPGSTAGTATDNATITAALVGGGTLAFGYQSNLSFDPSVQLAGPEVSSGSGAITVDSAGNYSLTGTLGIQMVPEPSALISLSTGLLCVVGYWWRSHSSGNRTK